VVLTKWNFWIVVAAGVAYGLLLRLLAFSNKIAFPQVMSGAFIFGVPVVMGFISIYGLERHSRQSVLAWIFAPWVTVSVMLLGTMVAAWEGSICVVMFAPIGWICGTVGGVLGGLVARLQSRRIQNTTLSLVVLLPFLLNPFAQKLLLDYRVRTVATSIDIHAPAEVVWHNIERVPSIHANELPAAWSRRIGFPAPDEATLSFEGTGAVRHATFAGGVAFTETVDTWEPNHRLAFSIRANTDRIPATTLDEHVRIGGPYFDVLHGDYEIEALPNGITRLHLSSRHRVSTDFNWYAQLWTDAVMRDIQNSILFVIKNRCERH